MKSFSHSFRIGLLVVILLVLFAPILQELTCFFDLKPLNGFRRKTQEPELTYASWLSGDYQKESEKYLSENLGFHESLIRMTNQIDYSCFDQTHAHGMFIGQEGYLFDKKHLNAYLGNDFVGTDKIREQLTKLDFIQAQLKPFNKQIILVFVPGKVSFFPEYLPKNTAKRSVNTNIKTYLNELKSHQIPYIDFYHYFLRQKKKSNYTLFPKLGIHWSTYSSAVASDSIVRYIEHLYRLDLPNSIFTGVSKKKAHQTDIDLLELLNLMRNPPLPLMDYPSIQFESVKQHSKPPVLVIGDSYYWGIHNQNIAHSFGNYHFWFYNKEVYPESAYSTVFTNFLDLKEQIAQHDVILILANDASLADFSWGFIEQIELQLRDSKTMAYLRADYTKKLDFYKKGIYGDKNWLKIIQEKANQKHISLDSMVTLDAQWLYNQYEVRK